MGATRVAKRGYEFYLIFPELNFSTSTLSHVALTEFKHQPPRAAEARFLKHLSKEHPSIIYN